MPQRDLSLKFVCPACRAKPHDLCHMSNGVICFESHFERRELAKNVPPPEHVLSDVHRVSRIRQAS
jgi:hypothetical protein